MQRDIFGAQNTARRAKNAKPGGVYDNFKFEGKYSGFHSRYTALLIVCYGIHLDRLPTGDRIDQNFHRRSIDQDRQYPCGSQFQTFAHCTSSALFTVFKVSITLLRII